MPSPTIPQSDYRRGASHLMPPIRAEHEAERLRSDELSELPGERWTYRACHDPTGRGLSFIAVYDADGVFLGSL